MDKLKHTIEAIIFLSGDAVAISDISQKLDVTAKDVENAAKQLQEKYTGQSGIHLLMFNKKLQFCSNPDYAENVETVLNPIKERELSKTMMEVAAIVAYKQPVTRLEIEEVRGVNSDYAVLTLTKHNIIEVVGRKDAIGKPLLYGTTDEFLKRFQLTSLSDLPDYEDLLGRIKILHSDNTDLYYREQFDPDSEEQQEGYSLVSTVSEEPELLTQLQELERQNKPKVAIADLGAGKVAAGKHVNGKAADNELSNDGDILTEAAATIDPDGINGNAATIDTDVLSEAAATIDTDVLSEVAATIDDGGINENAAIIDADVLSEVAATIDADVLSEVAATIDAGGLNERDDLLQADTDGKGDELPDFLKGEKDLKRING